MVEHKKSHYIRSRPIKRKDGRDLWQSERKISELSKNDENFIKFSERKYSIYGQLKKV